VLLTPAIDSKSIAAPEAPMSGSAHRGISDAGRPQSITAADPALYR
jgi:hypothetical protein